MTYITVLFRTRAQSPNHGDADGPFALRLETEMDRQQSEINEFEMTTEELDAVSGGVRNNQTEAWAAFQTGIIKGFLEAGGGHASCTIE